MGSKKEVNRAGMESSVCSGFFVASQRRQGAALRERMVFCLSEENSRKNSRVKYLFSALRCYFHRYNVSVLVITL